MSILAARDVRVAKTYAEALALARALVGESAPAAQGAAS
jgi:hypothetical protein